MTTKAKRALAPVSTEDVSRPANDEPAPQPAAPSPRFIELACKEQQLLGATVYLASIIAVMNDDLLAQKVELAQTRAELKALRAQ